MNLRLTVLLVVFLAVSVGAVLYTEAAKIQAVKMDSWTTDIQADCGVVLTGGAGRIREGIDLLSQGQIRKLIISGVNPQTRLHEIFPLEPYYPSVKAEDIILERRSTTTYGNVHQTLALVEALRCRSMALITSHTHMYRAKRTFQGASDIPLVERAVVSGELRPEFLELLNESAKSLFYSLWAY